MVVVDACLLGDKRWLIAMLASGSVRAHCCDCFPLVHGPARAGAAEAQCVLLPVKWWTGVMRPHWRAALCVFASVVNGGVGRQFDCVHSKPVGTSLTVAVSRWCAAGFAASALR